MKNNDWILERVLWLIERSRRIRGHSVEKSMNYLGDTIDPSLLAEGIRTFSGKWKLSILWYLRHRSLRFGELASLLPGVTAKVLTYQLRELVEAGLVSKRTSIAPRRTRYALTEYGIDAMPLLELLCEWGQRRITNLKQSTVRLAP